MNRSLAAWSVPPSAGPAARHPGLDPAGQPLEAVLDAQRRAGDRADEQRPEHDEQREAGADGVAQGRVGHGDRRQPRDEQGDQAEHVGDDRAGVLAQAVTDQHPQTGADEHCENVENGPETGKQRGHRATLRGWFNDHLSGLPPGAPGV